MKMICKWCGEEFTAQRKDAIYCSPKCRKNATRNGIQAKKEIEKAKKHAEAVQKHAEARERHEWNKFVAEYNEYERKEKERKCVGAYILNSILPSVAQHNEDVTRLAQIVKRAISERYLTIYKDVVVKQRDWIKRNLDELSMQIARTMIKYSVPITEIIFEKEYDFGFGWKHVTIDLLEELPLARNFKSEVDRQREAMDSFFFSR